MNVNISLSEYSTIIESNLQWIEDWTKHRELEARLRKASACRTEKERAEILSYSEAFCYVLNVEDGIISLTRVPPSSDNEDERQFIYEAITMAESILPVELPIAMGENPEILEIIKQEALQSIVEEVRSVFSC